MTSSPNFGTVAATYARLRPGYPPAVFDDLAALTGIPNDASILEIGPATGQATRPLVERGYLITGVDSDAALVDEAHHDLDAFPNVELYVSRFEDWPLPAEPFDLVLSATAFHWIDPAVRYVKAASALKRNGWLAVIHTYHVKGGSNDFFQEVQSCYQQYMPADSAVRELREADSIQPNISAYEASGLFKAPTVRRYLWQESYTARVYTDLLGTYSDHLALPEETRSALFDRIASLIVRRFDGRIAKQYLTELVVAQKR